jgi:alkanesulfonate monooxygenase SsuD/methylene tetrahydromethanopterin reductase-like flavin-dependent oxidoreductase (luciferase family)
MEVGVGLPTAVPGTTGALAVEWARRAEQGPFASLGVLDRVRYHSYDPFLALAAASAVTSRVRLATMIVIAPLRNPVLLAKEAASLDALSGGRLTLGVAVGARQDDYETVGVDHRGRGRRLSEQLALVREAWEDGPVGPRPARPDGPELLVGGLSGQAFVRVARYADGYVHGGGPHAAGGHDPAAAEHQVGHGAAPVLGRPASARRAAAGPGRWRSRRRTPAR